MNYYLPKSVEIDGTEYEIRSDYRAALDVCTALSDPGLSDEEKAYNALLIFYPAFENEMPPRHYETAIEEMYRFLNGGELDDNPRKQPRMVDWEQLPCTACQNYPLYASSASQPSRSASGIKMNSASPVRKSLRPTAFFADVHPKVPAGSPRVL